MNLLDDRDRRTIHRKLSKKNYDQILTMSTGENSVRLLDEGAVVTAGGGIDIYIMKGTLDKYVNGKNQYLPNLDDSYEGSINVGHADFTTFPFLIGKWTRSDLSLEDTEDGRQALNIVLHLDEESVFVQEIRRVDYEVGVSAEFYYHLNQEQTNEYGFPVIDEVFIRDFAIVGECGNVNSSNCIKEGANMSIKKILGLEEETVETDETVDEAVEPETDEPEEESAEAELVEALEAVRNLTQRVEALETENATLRESVSTYEKTQKEFAEQFKDLTVGMSKLDEEHEEPKVIGRYVNNDGIGE